MKTIQTSAGVDMYLDPGPAVLGMKKLVISGTDEQRQKAKQMMQDLASRCQTDTLAGSIDAWGAMSDFPIDQTETRFQSMNLGSGIAVDRKAKEKQMDDTAPKPKNDAVVSISALRKNLMNREQFNAASIPSIRKTDGYPNQEEGAQEETTIIETSSNNVGDFRTFGTMSTFNDTLGSFLRECTVGSEHVQKPSMWREDKHGGADLDLGAGSNNVCDEGERSRVSAALRCHVGHISSVAHVDTNSVLFRVRNAKEFCAALAVQGIAVVRDRGPNNYIRLKVGKPADNDAFLKALPEALAIT